MTRPTAKRLLPVAALLALGCGEDIVSLNEGALTTLTVRAYVDADGDGRYTAGTDVPIAGATITAEGDVNTLTAPTGAAGVANFSLRPGSYTLSFTGDAPAGAVLATASKPTVAAPFQGATLAQDFRFAFNPGSLAGTVFRDDDDDGAFDPAVDTPAGGLALALYEGTAAAGDPVASTATASDGSFGFDALRPGTYVIEVTPFPTIEIVGGNLQAVTVTAAGVNEVFIEFTGSLVVDMAEARAAADGDRVTIEGVITFQAPWRSTLEAFVQDGTAGFALFDFDCDFGDPAANCPQVAAGDLVQVSGVKSAFRGEVQLTDIALLEILDSPGEPQDVSVSGNDVNRGARQGELVTAYGTVDSVVVLDGFDNHRAWLTDMAGTVFTAQVDSRIGVGSADWSVGAMVAVTGNLGFDNRNTPAARIEPRTPDDLVFDDVILDIASARGMVGADVTVEGVVTWEVDFDTRVYFFQDETGGLTVFDANVQPALQRGDKILISGTVSSFRGEVQLSPVNAVRVISQAAVPAPRAVDGAAVNAGSFQGELVTLEGTVDSLNVFSFDNHLVWMTDGAGTVFEVYVDSRTGVGSADWTAGDVVQVTGVLGTDDRNDPAARVEIRGPADVVPTGVAVVSIAAARAMSGETVTVEGVVTWDVDFDTRVYFFQDATGGFTVFDSNVQPDLAVGDRIRVTGEVSAFRGETQLSPVTAAEVLGREAVPFPRGVTGAEINAGSFQGELVTLAGTADSLDVFSFDNHLVWMTDGDGAVFEVYVDSRTGVGSADWDALLGTTVQVTGVLGTDDRNDPAPRVEIRSPADVN